MHAEARGDRSTAKLLSTSSINAEGQALPGTSFLLRGGMELSRELIRISPGKGFLKVWSSKESIKGMIVSS